MKLITAIWNGPFYIGKLSQPVTVGDVLLKLLETLWRAVVSVIAILLALGASLAAWIYVIEPVIFPPAKGKVEISADYDDGTGVVITNIPPPGGGSYAKQPPKPFRCSKDYPIKVTIMNKSRDEITDVTFSLEAFMPNSSRNVIKTSGSYRNDVVLKPKSGWITCYSAEIEQGFDANSLVFKAKVLDARYY